MTDATEVLRKKYEEVTTAALALAQKAPKNDPRAAEVIDMAERYVSDAKHFHKQGDTARALAALSYAHGWLDCGARMKLFTVHDSRLFTVDEE